MLEQEEVHCVGEVVDHILEPILGPFGVCKPFKDYHLKNDTNGNPLVTECQKNNFAMYYATPEALTLFNSIYHNELGMQDKFVAYWAFVSKALSSNPYVIGFDPFNEPPPSWRNVEDALNTILPGHFDREKLAPMYARIHAAYMNASSDNINFFEPCQAPDAVLGEIQYAGFEVPPGGQIGSPNHVLNDHTYCCTLSGSMCKTGEPDPKKGEQCLKWHEKRLKVRSEDAKRLGIPLIISEFGACLDSEVCVREIS